MEQSASVSYSDQNVDQESALRSIFDRATPYRRSYVNDAVEVLRSVGRSMKLQELQTSIGSKRGKSVSLGSLKVCLSRYVDTSDSSKLLTRVAPGLFALSEWTMNGAGFNASGLPQSGDYGSTNGGMNGWSRMPPPFPSSNGTALPLFLWTAAADEHSGKDEQRVYVRAANEGEAIKRLQYAGVQDAELGTVQPL